MPALRRYDLRDHCHVCLMPPVFRLTFLPVGESLAQGLRGINSSESGERGLVCKGGRHLVCLRLHAARWAKC